MFFKKIIAAAFLYTLIYTLAVAEDSSAHPADSVERKSSDLPAIPEPADESELLELDEAIDQALVELQISFFTFFEKKFVP